MADYDDVIVMNIIKFEKFVAHLPDHQKNASAALAYEGYFSTSPLQFGFKPGMSADMCTGLIKNVVGHYYFKGSSVFGCFLDASKAFD